MHYFELDHGEPKYKFAFLPVILENKKILWLQKYVTVPIYASQDWMPNFLFLKNIKAETYKDYLKAINWYRKNKNVFNSQVKEYYKGDK